MLNYIQNLIKKIVQLKKMYSFVIINILKK